MTAAELCAIALAGLCVDLAIGDPPWLPHPVRGIGRATTWLEPRLTARLGRGRAAGAVFAATIIGAAYASGTILVAAAFAVHPVAGYCASIYLVATAVSTRDLDREARAVASALARGGVGCARVALARIVGRDTEQLEDDDVIRGAVECVAESTVDGCVTPLCFAILIGPAAALAFKAVSTLDSMVGHRNERYATFGTASARADDVAGYLPARLARALIPIAALVLSLDARRSLAIGWRDGARSPSPNAGIPEACVAGALGIQLGGPLSYAGVATDKPTLGDATRPRATSDIARSISLMYVTTGLAWAVLAALALAAQSVLS